MISFMGKNLECLRFSITYPFMYFNVSYPSLTFDGFFLYVIVITRKVIVMAMGSHIRILSLSLKSYICSLGSHIRSLGFYIRLIGLRVRICPLESYIRLLGSHMRLPLAPCTCIDEVKKFKFCWSGNWRLENRRGYPYDAALLINV
jgi:hypothetical protein